MLKICLYLTLVAGTVSGQCEGGWASFGQSCYRLLTPAQSFDFYRESCENLGGRLVSIVSAGENAFVSQLQQAECSSGQCEAFIGLRRNSAGQFQSWLDGASFGGGFFSNWNTGEPNNVGGGEGCAEMIQNTGKWNDISCANNRLGMCEKAQPSRCGTGWTLSGECCYRLLIAVRSFDANRSDCQSNGGDLVSISSAAKNNFVQQLPETGCSSCPAAFIGLRRDGAGQFTSWLDGTPFGGSAFSNWNTNEPNNVGGSENCGELIPDTGKWNDISCDSGRIAVCEVCPPPATTSTTTTTTTTTTPLATTTSTTTTAPTTTTPSTTTPTTSEASSLTNLCESGWSPFGRSCYRVSTELRSSADHHSVCESLGGWLVSINSAAENDFVNELQQDVGCPGPCAAYIGKLKSSGSFWLDGTPFGGTAYSNLGSGGPNAANENCVEMLYHSGKWYDQQCNAHFAGVCEKPQTADWCAPGWKPFGQCCYRVDTALFVFSEHRLNCLNRGGELVSINRHTENKFVHQLQQAGCTGSSCNAFIGLRRNSAGEFASWLDGTPLGETFYVNWNSQEPSNRNERCAEMIYDTGKWNDIGCDLARIAVCAICQPPTPPATAKPTSAESTGPATPTTTTQETTTPSTTEFITTPGTTEATSTLSTTEYSTTPITTKVASTPSTAASTAQREFDCRTVRTNVNCSAANGPAACDAQCRLFKYGRGICFSFGTTTSPGYPLGSKGCLCYDTLDCRTLRTQVNCAAANAAASCTNWCRLFQWTQGACTTFQSSWTCPGYAAGQAACLCQ